jgi:hypothetical protein
MRDETIINEFKKMYQHIQNLEGSVRLAFTGQEVRGAALADLLLTKPAMAEKEVHEFITKLTNFFRSPREVVIGTDGKMWLTFAEEDLKALEADLKSVLYKGPILTNDEMTVAVGNTIQKMQQQAEDAAKKQATEIIKPTTEQVQQVVNTPVQAEVATPEVPPQA